MGRITQRGDEVNVVADLVNTADGRSCGVPTIPTRWPTSCKCRRDITHDISNRLQHASERQRDSSA